MKISASSNSFKNEFRKRYPTDLINAPFDQAAPLKSLGQNFLVSEHYCDLIISSLSLDKNTNVVEIGPGRGALTSRLSKLAGHVEAIELDRKLAEALRKGFQNTNVEITHSDAMKVDFREFCIPSFSIQSFVANLPYYLATPIVVKAIGAGCFDKVSFMIQKELAERFVASPGSKEYGAITVLLQVTCDVRILFPVPRSVFHPVPNVDSCFVQLLPNKFHGIEIAAFSRFVRGCFSSRRKTIKNNLLSLMPSVNVLELLKKSNVLYSQRPEQLTPDVFLRLFSLCKNDFKD